MLGEKQDNGTQAGDGESLGGGVNGHWQRTFYEPGSALGGSPHHPEWIFTTTLPGGSDHPSFES